MKKNEEENLKKIAPNTIRSCAEIPKWNSSRKPYPLGHHDGWWEMGIVSIYFSMRNCKLKKLSITQEIDW